jgi:sn-glycerol 3-phosphate transport system ATP-binding protein
VVTPLEPKDRDIAMVFQNYALYPHKTIFENLAYGLRIRKRPETEIGERVKAVSSLLQIDHLLERRPAQLSGGQQQRVAMGRAIMREPQAFLFDEPLSNLDAKLRNHMRVEIRQLQQRLGITTLYVTHDQVEAMTMSDRIVVLNRGDIEQIGRPLEIYERPQSLFVANFIGSPAMNLVKVKTDGGDAVLASGERVAAGRKLPSGDVTLGIRPERIKLSGRKGVQSLPYRISMVEELGSQKIVHGAVKGTDLVVAYPEDSALPDGDAFVDLPANYLHFFDTASGRRI